MRSNRTRGCCVHNQRKQRRKEKKNYLSGLACQHQVDLFVLGPSVVAGPQQRPHVNRAGPQMVFAQRLAVIQIAAKEGLIAHLQLLQQTVDLLHLQRAIARVFFQALQVNCRNCKAVRRLVNVDATRKLGREPIAPQLSGAPGLAQHERIVSTRLVEFRKVVRSRGDAVSGPHKVVCEKNLEKARRALQQTHGVCVFAANDAEKLFGARILPVLREPDIERDHGKLRLSLAVPRRSSHAAPPVSVLKVLKSVQEKLKTAAERRRPASDCSPATAGRGP